MDFFVDDNVFADITVIYVVFADINVVSDVTIVVAAVFDPVLFSLSDMVRLL